MTGSSASDGAGVPDVPSGSDGLGRPVRPAGPSRRSTRRLRNKTITRAYLIAVAGAVFDLYPYEAATMRRIAAQAGVSVGTIGVHFSDKAELWRAAMGREPPIDSLLSRSALALFEALEGLVSTRTSRDATPLWAEAEALVARLKPASVRPRAGPGGPWRRKYIVPKPTGASPDE